MNVEKYLKDLYKTDIKPIKTNLGLSNVIYKFTYNNNDYALRIPLNEGSINHRQLERQIQEKAKEFDFEEVYYNPQTNIRITKWVDNLKTLSEYNGENKYSNIINRINQFHNIKISTSLKFDLENKYNYFKSNIKKQLIDYTKYESLINNYNNLNLDYVISHNDLVDGNICFKDGFCYLIDYEYASLNYEYFDIMSLLSENRIYDAETRNNIYKLYFGDKFNDEILAKCNCIELAQNILWSAWANLEYENKNNEIYLDIFKDKTKRIEILK